MELTQEHNWPVDGHDWAVNYLRRSLAHQRTRHAYLITGPASVGKSQLAHAFAMALNCTDPDENARPCGMCRSCKLIGSGNHPDILYSQSDENSGQLKIDAIREVMRLIALKPYDSRYRIALFHDFDRAQPRAQDALLKTLEEPPPHAVIILMAQSSASLSQPNKRMVQPSEGLMATITSRCQVVPLRPVASDIIESVLLRRGAEPERAKLLARLSSGRINWAINALDDDAVLLQRDEILDQLDVALRGNRSVRFALSEQLASKARKDRDYLRYILEIWQTYWRDAVLMSQDSPVKLCNIDRQVSLQQLLQRTDPDDSLTALQATRHTLSLLSTNANIRMALDVLMLDYPGLSR